MTTKLREWLIETSRDQRKRIKRKLICSIIVASMLIITLLTRNTPLIILTAITFMGMAIFVSTLNAIKRKKKEIIERNKLRYVLLSDSETVSEYLCVVACMPIAISCPRFLEKLNGFNFVIAIIMLSVILVISVIIASEKIAKHFSKKLSK